MQDLLGELQERFGEKEGFRIFNTILPGIMADFNNMLKAVGLGTEVSEEYRLEDGSGIIKVTGKRLSKGDIEAEAHLK